MEAMPTLPRLFMRSVTIMVTNAATPLIKWVLELLTRLIKLQVGCLRGIEGCICVFVCLHVCVCGE